MKIDTYTKYGRKVSKGEYNHCEYVWGLTELLGKYNRQKCEQLYNIHGLIKGNMPALQEQIFSPDYILKELIT